MRAYVIGFIGSDRKRKAAELAEKYNLEIIDLASYIEQEDGRSLLRLCMTMGEHELHNKEYEALCKLQERDNFILICTDGIILDEMNVAILNKGSVYFEDEPFDTLWQNAKQDASLPYAFMQDSDESLKYAKFAELYNARISLYRQLIKN